MFVGVGVGLNRVLLGVGLGVGCVGLGVKDGVGEGCLSFIFAPELVFIQTSVSVGGAGTSMLLMFMVMILLIQDAPLYPGRTSRNPSSGSPSF